MDDLRLYGETGSMRKRGPQKKRIETPCRACYRPVYPAEPYCSSCEASGAAGRHQATLPPTASPARSAANPTAVVRVEGGAPLRPASAAVLEPQRREPRQRKPRPPKPRQRKPRPPKPRQRKPRRRTGDQADPRAAANRSTSIGVPVSQQHPARDAAMRLVALPGVAVTVHAYADAKRVKSAIWYLRNRCDLPLGFRFWRDGEKVVGVYEPASGVVESGVQTTTGPEAASEPVIPATETPPGGIS